MNQIYNFRLLSIIYLILSFITYLSWEKHRVFDVTGDEPHYLVMANGIAQYHTFEQTKPYRREFRTREIYAPGLAVKSAKPDETNTHAVKGPHGLYNAHNIGFPLLLALPFALGGTLGAKFFVILIGLFVIYVTWKLAGLFFQDERSKFVSVILTCVAYPLLPGSNQIYPDILAGSIALSGIYWLLTFDKKRSTFLELAWISVIAFLPWLQIKFGLTCAILILSIFGKIYYGSRDIRRILILQFPVTISCLLLLAYNHYAFGKMSGPYQPGAIEISENALMVFLGLHLDQNQGHLMLNPLGAVGLFSIGSLFARRRQLFLIWSLVYLSLILLNAMHPNWYGGGSFSGRFNWSAAIVFVFPILYGMAGLSEKRKSCFWLIVLLLIIFHGFLYYQRTFEMVSNYNRSIKLGSVLPSEGYSVYFGPWVDNFLPMLYNLKVSKNYMPNVAWIIFSLMLVFSGFLAKSCSKRRVLVYSWFLLVLLLISGFCNNGNTSKEIFVYQSKDMRSQTGQVEGNSRSVKSGRDLPGYVTFGPYISLPKDDYAISIFYRSSASPETVIGQFDAVAQGGKVNLAKLDLSGSNNLLKVVVLNFEVRNGKGANDVEFRNLWNGQSELTVEKIVLENSP